jgi:2'-hydroxyisoflavone reductase
VSTEQLLAAGLDPWMGVPLWIAAPGWEAANRVPNHRALAAGLAFRPLAETVRAALVDETEPTLRFGLQAERESELLERLAHT